MKLLLRIAYRSMIRMHPASFRTEFGDEMLWIFDETSRNGSLVYLFFDGLRSVVVQRIKPRAQLVVEGNYYCDVSSSVPPVHLAQAGFILVSGVVFLSILGSSLVPRAVKRHWSLTHIKISASPSETKPAKI